MFLSWHIQLHTLTTLRLLARICKHTNQGLHIATQEHKIVSAVVSKSNDEQIIDPHLIFKLTAFRILHFCKYVNLITFDFYLNKLYLIKHNKKVKFYF